jgi:sugar phosphate isomerase/epimerase
MGFTDRRNFLRAGVAASVCALVAGESRSLKANPYGLPVGLELYTVREQLAKNFAGTLSEVATIGYKTVELSGFFGETAPEIKRLLASDGLTCPAAHYGISDIETAWEQRIEDAQVIGMRYMVLPGLPESMRGSVDGYKRAAEFLNKTGAQCRKAGIQFAYHNHNVDFEKFNGVVAFDVMLEQTDPSLVQFEMDCFWVTRAGYDPVAYMERYPGRFPLLHIKDEKPGYPPTATGHTPAAAFTEVGRGKINWKRIFMAAPKGGLKYFFVEQDECDVPPMKAIKISYKYLHKLTV